MKKIGVLIVVIMLMASFTTAWAENKEDSFSFTPFIGGYVFEGNQNSKNAMTGGLRAGYNFTKNWGMEGFYAYVPSQFRDTGETNRVYIGGIEGLYNFFPDGRFVPFAAIGIGGFHYSDDRPAGEPTNFAVDYGVGLKFYMTENIALRADVRHVLPLNDRYNDFLYTLGINFNFGGGNKEIKEVKKEIAETKQEVVEAKKEIAETKKEVVETKKEIVETKKEIVKAKEEAKTEKPLVPAAPEVKVKEPPAPKSVAPAEVEKKQVKVSFILKVQFDKAPKQVIKKKYHKYIERLANFMKAHPETSIEILGHTGNAGKEGYNMLLSQKRADSVRLYLIKEFGIKASRIHALGYGPNQPIASNKTKKGQQKNERIEVIIEGLQVK